MTVSLQKGAVVSLAKEDPTLSEMIVGLGWKPRKTDGPKYDLDASAFALNADGRCPTPQHFVFYGKKESPDGAIVHGGDNTDGEGEGDDEEIFIDLRKVEAQVQRIAITVSIYDYVARKQNFGQVGEAYIRIVNKATGVEILKYELGEDYSGETAMIFGELYLRDGGWRFRAVGQGYNGGLQAMAAVYGVAAA